MAEDATFHILNSPNNEKCVEPMKNRNMSYQLLVAWAGFAIQQPHNNGGPAQPG